jgi:hypothetical protein
MSKLRLTFACGPYDRTDSRARARYINDLARTNREIATRLPPLEVEHLVPPADGRPVLVDRRDPLGAPTQTLLCQTHLPLLLRRHRHLGDQVELADVVTV